MWISYLLFQQVFIIQNEEDGGVLKPLAWCDHLEQFKALMQTGLEHEIGTGSFFKEIKYSIVYKAKRQMRTEKEWKVLEHTLNWLLWGTWSYPLMSAKNMTVVTNSKQCIHFAFFERRPLASTTLKKTIQLNIILQIFKFEN